MVTLTISADFKDVQRRLDGLQREVREQALVRAVNRTTEQARTDMSREIRSEFVMSAERVRDQLRVVRAGFKQGRAVIEARLVGGRAKGRSLNLIRFVERRATLADGKRRGKAGTQARVFVQIKRKGGKKALGPAAFIGNQGRTVFERVGPKRLPIKAKTTIDVAQMFNTKRINAAVVRKLRDKFPAIVEREVAFYVRKFNATK